MSEAAYLYQAKATALKDRRLRFREVHTDMDGYVSELLSKAVSNYALDEALTAEDRERLLEYLRSKGALDASGRYAGGQLRGADSPAAADGTPRYTPFKLDELLGSRTGYYLDLWIPVSAVDAAGGGRHGSPARALAARLGKKIIYKAAVSSIRQRENGVTVVYRDGKGGSQEVQADYCVAALPLPLLAQIDTDFPADFKDTIAKVPYAAAGKMGMQFSATLLGRGRSDFGGASKTDMEIGQIVYPSAGYLGQKGVLVGYYLQGQAGRPIGDKTPAERLALAMEQGGKIHPQYPKEFENAFSVAWHRVTWNKGSWSNLNPAGRKALSEPQGRVYLAGDHLNLNAWMQGAFESARHTATAVHTRAAAERATARV